MKQKLSGIYVILIFPWRSSKRCKVCLLWALYILLAGEYILIIWQRLLIQNGAEQLYWNRYEQVHRSFSNISETEEWE